MLQIVHNVETQEIMERPYTAQEIATVENERLENEKRQAIINAEETAKATKKAALLEKLGITAEEAQLLLGGN